MPRPKASKKPSPKPTSRLNMDQVFHALGDSTRRAIIETLSREGPQTVSHLAEPLSITLTAVAQHLQILEESGLVRTEKIGRTRTCSLELGGLAALEQWSIYHRTEWEKRLDRLGRFLAEEEDNA